MTAGPANPLRDPSTNRQDEHGQKRLAQPRHPREKILRKPQDHPLTRGARTPSHDQLRHSRRRGGPPFNNDVRASIVDQQPGAGCCCMQRLDRRSLPDNLVTRSAPRTHDLEHAAARADLLSTLNNPHRGAAAHSFHLSSLAAFVVSYTLIINKSASLKSGQTQTATSQDNR